MCLTYMISDVSIQAYKGINNIGTASINDMFEVHEGRPGLQSPDTLNIKQQNVRTTFGSESLLCMANSYWMLLPNAVKQSPSLNIFKRFVSNCFS